MTASAFHLSTACAHTSGARMVHGWSHVDSPGFYVSAATGHGFRVAAELLLRLNAPAVEVPAVEGDWFLCISDDPLISTMAAKLLCVDSNIAPGF